VPKISAPTVAEHREQRRLALHQAATDLILRDGAFTVAEVAAHVGLSRSAVYEYYSCAADLIADVLVDELADWADVLSTATREAWVRAVLRYVADGRHALVRAAGAIDLPPTRRAEVSARHRDLIEPLHEALSQVHGLDADQAARLVWGVVDAAIGRIEASETDGRIDRAFADREADATVAFVHGGLRRLASRR
jgi:AcrR family transcriptional regulator